MYSEIKGGTECKGCLSMTYQDRSGQKDCKNCPEGEESGPMAVACATWSSFNQLPFLPQMSEDNLYTYQLSLTKAPLGVPVYVSLTSNNPICSVPEVSNFVFDDSNWNIPKEIVIKIGIGEISTAKGSELDPCDIDFHELR